jgi:hypothetical protein
MRKERFNLASQHLVCAARFAQKRRALAFVAREGVVIQLFDVPPAIRSGHAINWEEAAHLTAAHTSAPKPTSRLDCPGELISVALSGKSDRVLETGRSA